MAQHLVAENVWLDKPKYEDAERIFYENKARAIRTPLAAEVGKVREWLTNMKNTIEEEPVNVPQARTSEDSIRTLEKIVTGLERQLSGLVERVKLLEDTYSTYQSTHAVNLKDVSKVVTKEDDDDVDLFGSDSEEDEAAQQVREKRLADYEAKKSKKPVLIAKSNIILDVKPWDDETDMKKMEKQVRGIQADGLVWGAAKLQPLAYGIHKLQISCVVEDDLVSIDWLQEQIEELSDYVQSVDIAAFNKV